MSEHTHDHDCNCGCNEEVTVTLTLDNDEIVECAVLTIYPVDDKEYIALLPLDEEGDNEDGEVYIYRYVETEDGWHTYAVDWSPEGYIFYFDGVEIGRQMAPEVPVSNVDQFILVSTECHGYHRQFANDDANASAAGDSKVWAGEPVKELYDAVLPDEFIVDYVRVFDEVK